MWLDELGDEFFDVENLVGGDHGDDIPGADLGAEGAADAAWEVDLTGLHDGLELRSGDGVDAIDGADGNAGLAAGAKVFIKNCESFRESLSHVRGAEFLF